MTAAAPAYTRDWFGDNVPVWTRLLAPLAGRPGVRALEIGCFEGRATCRLLDNVLSGADARIDCADTFEGSDEYASMEVSMAGVRERFEANVAPWRDRVETHVGPSADVLRRLDRRYDLVYVDASHAAADVIADAFRACYAGHYTLLHVGYQVAVRKLPAYDRAAAAAVLPPRMQGHAE